MIEFRFAMGGGSVTFTQNQKDHLVMTAENAGQVYCLEFLDSVTLGNTLPGRCSTVRTMESFAAHTRFEAGENTLLAVTEIAPGVEVCNRFTVSPCVPKVAMDTWVQAAGKVYDAALIAGRTKMDPAGFSQIGGGDCGRFFPIEPCPPTYGFKGHMILRGENRYLKVEGGFLWHERGFLDAHFQSGNFHDDITCFTENAPISTVYSFGETENQVLTCITPAGGVKKTGSLVSGQLAAEYAATARGVSLLCKGNPYPMAALLAKEISTGAYHYLDTESGWNTVTVTEGLAGTEFYFMDHEAVPGVGLKILGESCPDNRIVWSVEAINQSQSHTLIWCDYPRLCYAPDEVCDLFHPYGGGDVEVGFNRTDGYKGSSYPAGLVYSMPYCAAYPTGSREKTGIYYAIHDPSGGYKHIAVSSTCRGGWLRFTSKYCAENLGEPANGFTLPGKAVWQAFTGDWFDATEIYRVFAETCPWMPADNSRIPQWMQELPFWIMDWIPNEKDTEEPIPISLRPNTDAYGKDCWFEIPLKLREELGVPFGYHLYNWHGNPFNNDFPHFFPPKKALAKGLPALKAAGIRMMPYINALLWDQRDRGGEDYQFTSVALPGAVKRESGEPTVLTYASHEPDGSKVKLSPMCPTSRVWREKLKENVQKCFELGMDGVYLDQTAAHGPHPCMDKTHDHKPGGGSWWSEEQRALLAELNAIKPDDKIFTSEGTAEVYAGSLDGLLSWAWIVVDKYVPAFMRIYGGKVMVLGRNANGYMKENDEYWKYHLAQGLVAGEQMGWINSDFVYNQQLLNYARKLIRFRYENRDFFRGARAMRPPVVETDERHKFACGIGMQWQGVLHEPYLCVGALENGRKKMLICVNLHTEEVSDKVWFKERELGLTADNFTVQGEGSAEYLCENYLQLTVSGESLLCLTWEVEE